MARAFGMVGHAYDLTKCETCEKWQSVRNMLKEFEDVSAVSNRTEREDMVVSQDDHAVYLLR